MTETDTRIYFWGGVFSNFHPICGDHSITSEKLFMMSKAIAFNDVESLKAICESSSPMAAKRLGRRVKNFDESIWNSFKETAMMSALTHKFAICQEFREKLEDSGEKLLVEASPDDRIWGIGFSEKYAEGNEHLWGENLLGKCLMNLRKTMYG